MSYLYVTEPKTTVRFEESQFVAEKKDGLKIFIPAEKLEGVVVIGNITITSRCINELLERGIPVTYLSSRGLFFGRLESTKHCNIERQRKQFRYGDNREFCLKLSKKFVSAKIHNQIVILRRYNRNTESFEVQGIIEFMQDIETKIEVADSIEQIMGYEGVCSRKYFQGLANLIDDDLDFNGRNRMPPKDPVNSLLSFGYTLLLYEIYTAIVNKGLHPYAAFMHKDRHGHPALASDLIEEWRPIIVDSLVLKLFRNYTFTQNDFITDEKTKGVFMKRDRIKDFISLFEKKLNEEISYAIKEVSRISCRGAIAYQTNTLAKAIDDENPDKYASIKIK